METSANRRTPRWVWAGLLVWASLLIAGFAAVELEANDPGELGTAPLTWPEATAITRDSGNPALLIFLHPHCPCSDASVSELERLTAAGNRGQVVAVLVKPAGASNDWEYGSLSRRVAAIQGVSVFVDYNSTEANRFGARTSGVVLGYDASGRLVYHGGITASRGHEGDNDGKTAAACCARGEASPLDSAPVYGCPLAGEAP